MRHRCRGGGRRRQGRGGGEEGGALLSGGVPVAEDDEDDAVVTLHFVVAVQRDLLAQLTGHHLFIPPVVRGVYHRGTAEGLTLATVKAPAEVPASRLAILEYVAPDGGGTSGRVTWRRCWGMAPPPTVAGGEGGEGAPPPPPTLPPTGVVGSPCLCARARR